MATRQHKDVFKSILLEATKLMIIVHDASYVAKRQERKLRRTRTLKRTPQFDAEQSLNEVVEKKGYSIEAITRTSWTSTDK